MVNHYQNSKLFETKNAKTQELMFTYTFAWNILIMKNILNKNIEYILLFVLIKIILFNSI